MSSDIIDETDEFGAPSSTPGEEWNLQEPIAFLRGENEYGETLEGRRHCFQTTVVPSLMSSQSLSYWIKTWYLAEMRSGRSHSVHIACLEAEMS